MADDHHIFARSTTSPFNVQLNTQIKNPRKLYLESYVVKGAPVTGGQPNSINYNIILKNIPTSVNLYSRNDSLQGIPIPLEGGYTEKTLSTKRHVANLNTSLANFTIEVTDESGNAATFTDVGFWFYLE
jgi:hypothetical protein